MSLPCFPSIGDPSFRWGEYDAVVVTESLETVYDEIVHWKPTLFKIPSGNVGKSFTSELSRLFLAFSGGSALESVALKAAFVMPVLLLQLSNVKAKEKSNKLLLERRLKLWEEGEFIKLLEEGRSLQKHRKIYHRTGGHKNNSSLSRSFANMIFQGKMGAALQLLSDDGSSSLLHPNDIADAGSGKTVMQILREKHPNGAAVDPGVILQPNAPFQLPHPVLFDQIDASLIRSVVLRTKGAAGPSGLNSYSWRRLCTSFKMASNNLCHALALLARRICSEVINPFMLSPLLACRLIAIDKKPGVRPIGIGEVVRRVVAKAALIQSLDLIFWRQLV